MKKVKPGFRNRQGRVFVSAFLLGVATLLLAPSLIQASVSIQMRMEPVGTNVTRHFLMPGEKVALVLKLVDADQQHLGGLAIDLNFDSEYLSISTTTDIEIASDIKDKKTLYKNLIGTDKLRVLLIGFNDKVIPNGSNLFTVKFKVIKKPVLLPGTFIHNHASSSDVDGHNIPTTANSLFIPILDSTSSLATISGRVTDSQTGQGLPGALVGLISEVKPEIFYQTLTDAFGNYTLVNLLEGGYSLLAIKDGYKGVTERNLSFTQGSALTKQITLVKGTMSFGFFYPISSKESPYLTQLSSTLVYGLAPTTIKTISLQGKYLPDYGAGDLIWSSKLALSTGENRIEAKGYDGNTQVMATDTIIIQRSSETDFKINIPIDGETYETSQSAVVVRGLTAPETVVIYLNGMALNEYQAGTTSWDTSINLAAGINYLNFTAKRMDGSLVGTDSIAILYDPQAPVEQLTITMPALGNYYKTGLPAIAIGGQTPSTTHTITINSTPLSGYVPGSSSWMTAPQSLTEGHQNLFTFKAFDSSGATLGEASINIEYEPGYVDEDEFQITTPTEEETYTADSQTINLGGSTPARTSQIRLNGLPITEYQPGSTSWSISVTLESGQNQLSLVAYDALGNEVGGDAILISFISNFGGLNITQPIDGSSFATKKNLIRLGGQTPEETKELMVNESLVTGYKPESATWSYQAAIALGSNRFVFTAYDHLNNIIGRDEITVTNPGVLQITKPSANNDATSGKKTILLGGTVSWSIDDPITTTIKINGQVLTGYLAGSPLFSYETELLSGENDFYALAYASSSEIPIGFDFIRITYRGGGAEPSEPAGFSILSPAGESILVQESRLTVQGEAPGTAQEIYRQGQKIAYTVGSYSWEDSIELTPGEYSFEYRAVDQSGRLVGSDTLQVIYNGVMRITEPVANRLEYRMREDTVRISLQIDTPGTNLLVNGRAFTDYAGQQMVRYSSTVQEGDNPFVFSLFDQEGDQTGYAKIIIKKGETNKDKVGTGLCFLQAIFPGGHNLQLGHSGFRVQGLAFRVQGSGFRPIFSLFSSAASTAPL